MNWNTLTEPVQLSTIRELSKATPVLIFKHSTRCSISSMSLERLLRNWKPEDSARIVPFYLDLIAFREVSQLVEETFGVPHQSPQVILIKDGKAFYDSSHFGISYPEIMKQL